MSAGEHRRRGDMDDVIGSVEAGVMNISTAEILWGGPRGDGLVHTVARLSQAVETLGKTVATLASQVTGSDGVQAQLTDVKADLTRLNAIVKWVAVGGGTIGGSGLAWLVGRSIQIAIVGHV